MIKRTSGEEHLGKGCGPCIHDYRNIEKFNIQEE